MRGRRLVARATLKDASFIDACLGPNKEAYEITTFCDEPWSTIHGSDDTLQSFQLEALCDKGSITFAIGGHRTVLHAAVIR